MAETMIERVARAIALASLDDETRAVVDPATWPIFDSHYDQARAAIKAMREPTNAMLGAAAKSMSPEHRPTEKRVGVKAKHGIRYRAMIDAALSEGGE